MGAQVVCGYKDDGSIATSESTSNGVKTCTYNKCYVVKQNIKCADESSQLLSGCCGPKSTTADSTSKMQKLFDEDCINYRYTFDDTADTEVPYCLTYNKDYSMEGTADAGDDQVDGKLAVDKRYVYTPCASSIQAGGGGSAAAAAAATAAPATTVDVSPAAGLQLAKVSSAVFGVMATAAACLV